ncbi:MAG: tetratricopeptide repeat protein [Gemmataceae bacterium]
MRRYVVLVAFLLASELQAGLHYSGETLAELPSRWRGFLLDHRTLRQVSNRRLNTLLRQHYEKEATRLTAAARVRTLLPDEWADLGALHIRLGDVSRAVEVLRPAHRSHPLHFRLAANLGTAWHLQGDLAQAAALLEEAVRLAPGKFLRTEQAHLHLVRLRLKERPGTSDLDNLFGVRFLGPSGRFEPGNLAPEERKRLPASAIATVQHLLLWMPEDARLLWLLGELANAHGEVSTAASILEGCTVEYGLRHPDLQAHRKLLREVVARETGLAPLAKKDHEGHAGLFKPRSSRPLLSKAGLAELPPIDPTGINVLAWEVIAETTVDRKVRPTFPPYLRDLDGRQVVLRGYMQPLGENTDLGAFLLVEHPVGCWYCEMPEMASIVLVELPPGQSGRYTRDPLRVRGKLQLNASDPENFLYIVREARVLTGGDE